MVKECLQKEIHLMVAKIEDGICKKKHYLVELIVHVTHWCLFR